MKYLAGLCALCVIQEALVSVIREKGLNRSLNFCFRVLLVSVIFRMVQQWAEKISGG